MTDTNTVNSAFEKPQEVDDMLLAFPGSIEHLMPAYEDIPESFRNLNADTKWHKAQHLWFYEGLPPGRVFTVKDGIDSNTAVRHLACIQSSFQPKHEHKVAAVAYLLSLWCDDLNVILAPPEPSEG